MFVDGKSTAELSLGMLIKMFNLAAAAGRGSKDKGRSGRGSGGGKGRTLILFAGTVLI